MRLLSEKESIRAKYFVELKEKIRMGLEELDRGEGIDGEEVFAELEADIKCIEAEMK